MWHILLFDFLIGGTLVYALVAGGAAERVAAIMLVLATVATMLVQGPATHKNYETVNYGVMMVDVALLVALAVLAIWSKRYWPVWLAGLQLVEVAVHLVRAVDPHLLPIGYVFILAVWSYPIVLLVAVGTFRHQRRMRLLGSDPSWKTARRTESWGARRGPAR